MQMILPGEPGGCKSPHCYLCRLRCLYSTPSLGKWQVLWFFSSSTLSCYLYSDRATRDHGSLWKDINLWKGGVCVWSSRVCVACATFQQRQSPGTTCKVSEGNTPCSAHQIVHIVEILQKTSTWINITQPNRSGQRGTKCSSASTAEVAAVHLD